MRRIPLVLLLCALALQARAADDLFGIDDLLRLADVGEPVFSPDGEYIAYSVTTNDLELDTPTTDLWRVRWDGSDRRALTHTPGADEWQPAVEPGRKMDRLPVGSRRRGREDPGLGNAGVQRRSGKADGFSGRRQRLRLGAGQPAACDHRKGSGAARGRGEAAATAADRHHALSVQGRRGRAC